MTEGVVAAQRQAAPLLRIGDLKSGIIAVGAGAKLVDIAESLIERLLVGKRRKASIADCLVAVQLHLVRLMEPARADVIHAQVAARTDLLLNAEVVLVVIRRLERSAGKGVQADGQRTGRCARLNPAQGAPPERKIV